MKCIRDSFQPEQERDVRGEVGGGGGGGGGCGDGGAERSLGRVELSSDSDDVGFFIIFSERLEKSKSATIREVG